MKKKVVPKLWQEVKVEVDIVTSEDIKIYHIGKFQDFTARCVIKHYIYYSKFSKDHFFLVKYFCILRKLHKYFCVS